MVPRDDHDRTVAIVGMACRFPHAPDPQALWTLLVDGSEALGEVPGDRWRGSAHVDPDRRARGKMVTARGGYLDDITQFDPDFFGISARETLQIDPQQRLALELAWEALEDAAVRPSSLRGSNAGVFMGAMWHDYERLHELDDIEQHSGTGWHLGVVPGRVSYALGLRGPSMAINTACSSSLVAVHLACKALLDGETSVALAGGVSLILTPHVGVAMSKFGGTSPRGRCFAYDARADGYVRGEGGGMVVLRRLSDALASGDRILACIRGSAVNNDGASEGLTVPSADAQQALLNDVYRRSGVDPAQIGFVEGHGTGTAVGDPIEARALGHALGVGRTRPLWLGSIKPNIGHTEAASGVASLIKATLAIRHGVIPPNLNFEHPNPAIDFDGLKLRVPTTPQPWTAPRLAGVNSFGFGGTNCHLVLAEPPPLAAETTTAAPRLLPVSARTAAGLTARVQQLRDLAQHDAVPLHDVAHTLLHGREHLEHRAAVVASTHAEVVQAIAHDRVARGQCSPAPAIAFAFSGQGSQWTQMGRGLWTRVPAFTDALRRCSAAMEPTLGWSVADAVAHGNLEPHLARVDGIQPAIYALQIALLETWRSLGVTPAAVVGHSMGEVAAAVAAGALAMEDGARITCARAMLLAKISGQGGMVSLSLPVSQAQQQIADIPGLCVAVDGGAGSTVVSGDLPALQRLTQRLLARDIEHRPVRVDVAAHSPQIDAIADALHDAIADITPSPTAVQMFSSVTAGLVTHDALQPAYWVRNLRDPVWFGPAAQRLLDDGFDTIVEVSPHPLVLYPLRHMTRDRGDAMTLVGTLRRDRSDNEVLLEAVAQLHCRGVPVALEQPGRPCSLPSYPWQRRRFWPKRRAATTTNVDAQLRLDPSRLPALGAHRVEGHAIVSAGVVLELAARAWAALGAEPGRVSIERLSLRAPLAGDRAVVLTLADGVLGVASDTEEPCVEGWMGASTTELPPPPPAARGAIIDTAHHHANLEARGVSYEPELRVIERITAHEGAVEAWIDPSASRAARLDAVFQAVLVAAPPGERYVTAELGAAVFDPGDLSTVHRVRAQTVRDPQDGSLRADAWLLDAHGAARGHVRGIRLAALARADSPLTTLHWEPTTTEATPTNASGWAVVGDDDRFTVAVVAALGAEHRPLPIDAAALADHRGLVVPLSLHGQPPLAATEAACMRVLGAARACVSLSPVPPLVIVTEQGEATCARETPQPGASAIQGLLGVLRVEHPGLQITTVDVPSATDPHWAAMLPAALGQSRVAIRCGPFGTRVLGPRSIPVPMSTQRWTPPRQGTVVVTGGMGGIGRAVSRWLVDRGVARVLMLGRRALDADIADVLHTLRSRGAGTTEVDYASVDIGDRQALGDALLHASSPVVGVIHTAAVLGDAPALALDPAMLRAVLWPKLQGAWNLHELTRSMELDHFVLFGSLGGWIGLPGQAAYAAANAFLDGLAAHRRSRGLPATAIGWCGWDELGFARTAGGAASLQRLAREGIGTLSAERALAVLDHALACETPPAFAVMPPQRTATAGPRLPLSTLGELSPTRQRAAISEHVLAEVAAVLREDIERIDPARPLRELGLDSLMSVELAERLGRCLDVEVSTTLIWRYPTADGLVGHFVSLLAPAAAPPPVVAPPESAPPSSVLELDAIVEQLGELSDEEVEALTGAL